MRLIDTAKDVARQLGRTGLALFAFSEAIPFYAKRGFTINPDKTCRLAIQ